MLVRSTVGNEKCGYYFAYILIALAGLLQVPVECGKSCGYRCVLLTVARGEDKAVGGVNMATNIINAVGGEVISTVGKECIWVSYCFNSWQRWRVRHK